MTHQELVKLAERWVRRTQRACPVVLSDVRIMASAEQPDVCAFGVWDSVLIECKASREDFKRDAYKSFRRTPASGVGRRRYYCAPTGLLTRKELPTSWGLLEPHASRSLRVVVAAVPFREVGHAAHQVILVSALQRATEGWGRQMFGEGAPLAPDGDPHPRASTIIAEQRRQIDAMRDQLRKLRHEELLPGWTCACGVWTGTLKGATECRACGTPRRKE